MSGVDDAAARRAAVDVSSSFIVRAPAGSGKTTVLVQRVLALLAQASRPEEVVALTFTRKAAAEMRARVLSAIERAALGRSSAGEPGRTTDQLAERALKQDRRLGWDLLDHPERLAVETIDAFNARLASHFAFESSGAAEFEISDDARPIYRKAVARLVNEWGREPDVTAWLDQLMLRLSNNLGLVEKALIALLSRREQWLPLVRPGLDDEQLFSELESNFAVVGQDLQAEVLRLIPASVGQAFVELPARFCSDDQPQDWSVIAGFWLTDRSEWRKRFGRQQGVATAQDRSQLKEIVAELDASPGLLEALTLARHSDAQAFSDADRDHLASLRLLLIRLAGHMEVIIAESGQADFIALAQGALQALGHIQAPSELLLALDYRIQHVLIDEFQDTSQDQFDLLLRLTAGWERNDGRTVFLVGDPMQSIYGFRNAEVGLFLQAWQNGLPEVPLKQLTLANNFRSEPALVEWVNERFAPHSKRSLVSFVPSQTAQPPRDGCVSAFVVETAADELRAVVETTQRQLAADPNQSIGILVRSRSHQAGLLRALAAEGIPAHGVEIDSLSERQTVQDLIGLTRALLNLADDIAWLGCLRAPWCGLRLTSIERLMALVDSRPLGSVLLSAEPLCLDDADDTARLERLRHVIRDSMARRGESGLSAWIEQTWMVLGGEHACDGVLARSDAEQFFDRLDGLVEAADFDPLALNDTLSEPLGGSDSASESGIEVMTIHKAKGLEFDTVILMGSGRSRGGNRDRHLLYWQQLFSGTDDAIRLMAPASRAKQASGCERLCRLLEARAAAAEELRLLYVGLTRARHRLFIPILAKSGKAPARSSLIAPIWDGFKTDAPPGVPQPETAAMAEEATLVRIPSSLLGELPAPASSPPRGMTESIAALDARAAAIGTAFHRQVERALTNGLTEPNAAHRKAIDNDLVSLGCFGTELTESRQVVLECFLAMLDDDRGRWLLEKHDQGASEFPLVILEGGAVKHYAVDRTFVADGIRWVVDYKTGSLPPGLASEDYLERQRALHWSQLQRYGLAMEQLAAEPVRLALYYPRFGGWVEWSITDPDPRDATTS